MRFDSLEAFIDRYVPPETRANDLKTGFGPDTCGILKHSIHEAISALREFRNKTHGRSVDIQNSAI
jgi:hypothetical protein